MACIKYKDVNFRPHSLRMIAKMVGIINDYQEQGYKLTVRQLYYQLVARDIIENTLQSYKNIASLVNDARIAGLIDWNAIEDRTREFITNARWRGGSHILKAVADQFHMDMWETQERRVFVIVEKEALVGVLEDTCRNYDVPLLAARGYPSASVIQEFCDKIILPAVEENNQSVVILHLGDHDPSGLDMTRDIDERVALFTSGTDFEIKRLALNMNQVEELKPPPNPAKATDARFAEYKRKFGTRSWELDALPPNYINELLETNISRYIDSDEWARRERKIVSVKKKMLKIATEFKD